MISPKHRKQRLKSVNMRLTWIKTFYLTFHRIVRHFLSIAVPTAPPLNVRVTRSGERKLLVSWNEPDRQIWSGKATRYKICYSTQQRASRSTCSETNRLSYEITSLQPFKRYFVTVSAGTSDGFGPKSEEISQTTDEGMNLFGL